MDEYAEYIYIRRPHYRNIDPGDLAEQKALREKLHCKPFKWFMEEIAFDLPLKYPPIEPGDFGVGEVIDFVRILPQSNLFNFLSILQLNILDTKFGCTGTVC